MEYMFELIIEITKEFPSIRIESKMIKTYKEALEKFF